MTDRPLSPIRARSSVEETERGLLAALHGEQLRIDVVRDDVVRVKISRGGAFDEAPTFAVCVDPLAEPADVHGRARTTAPCALRTSALVVTLGLDPFRLDVHRTRRQRGRRDSARRRRSAVGVRHAQRRLRRSAAAAGRRTRSTGSARRPGARNRKGRDFTLWNIDVLNDTRRGVHRGPRRGDPRATDEHRVRPVLRLDPVLLPPRARRRARWPRRSSTTATAATYDFSAAEEYAHPLRGRPVHGVRLRRPVDAARSSRPTRGSPGRIAPPPLWALGYHQCRWFHYTQDAVEALGAPAPRARHPVRRAVARHRVHGRLPRLHLGRARRSRTSPGCSSGCREQGFRVITIVDPGVKYEPGYAVFDQAWSATCCCRTEGGDVYIGQVWPGDTAFPDFVTEEARALVGRAQRRPRAVRAGRHLERHERAGHRRDPGRARCASTAARTRTSASTTSTRC